MYATERMLGTVGLEEEGQQKMDQDQSMHKNSIMKPTVLNLKWAYERGQHAEIIFVN